jgi:hypothetical protein
MSGLPAFVALVADVVHAANVIRSHTLNPPRTTPAFARLWPIALAVAVSVGCGGLAGTAGGLLNEAGDAEASRGSVEDATAIMDASAAHSDDLDATMEGSLDAPSCSVEPGPVTTRCNCGEIQVGAQTACAPEGALCTGRISCECDDAQWRCVAAP